MVRRLARRGPKSGSGFRRILICWRNGCRVPIRTGRTWRGCSGGAAASKLRRPVQGIELPRKSAEIAKPENWIRFPLCFLRGFLPQRNTARKTATKGVPLGFRSFHRQKRRFNAKTQRRQGAKKEKNVCVFAPLRLCVKKPARNRGKSSPKKKF